MPLVDGVESGGIPIISYSVESSTDDATWTALCGEDSDYLSTTYTESGLTTGDTWFFRYKVKNGLGWS